MALTDALQTLLDRGSSATLVKESVLKLKEPEKKEEIEGLHPEIKVTSTPQGEERVTTYPEGWTDETLKQFFISIKRQARDARAYKQSIRDEVWDLYNNLQDFSQKADWQMKEARPKVFMMIESVVAFFQLGLFKLRDWFDVVPINPRNSTNRVKAFIVKQILKFYVTQPEFIDEVLKALKWGFLAELFIMKIWEGEEKKYTVEPTFLHHKKQIDPSLEKDLPTIHQKILRRRRVMYRSINPNNFYLDWMSGEREGRFVIEEGKMDISMYQELVESGLCEDHVDEIINDATGQTLDDVKRLRQAEQVTTPPSTYFKDFSYHEYWGDIVDTKGKAVMRNIHFIIAAEKYIIVKPEVIDFFDGEHPYVYSGCIDVPGSVYKKSLVEPIAGLAKMMTELINLTFDALFATVLNVFEVDIERVQNVDDLANGIGPNTVIQKTGPEKVLEVTQVGKVPGEAFAGIQFLDAVLEQDTAISKAMIGFPTSTRRQTKAETQQQTEFTITFFQALVQNIEIKFLAPILKKIWFRVLQFPHDLSHPKLADLIGEEAASLLNKMTAEERYDVINGDYEIRVTGLSGLIAKREQLNNIFTFLRVIGRNEAMMAVVDPIKLVYDIIELLDIDPQRVTRDQPQLPVGSKVGAQLQTQTQPGQNGQGTPGQNGMNLQQLMEMAKKIKAQAMAGNGNEPATIAEE